MAENTGKKRRITLVTRLGYGAGNLVGSGALAISASWLTIFYTTYCGLTMAQATFIYSFALIFGVGGLSLLGMLSAKLMKMDKRNDEIAIAECARIAAGGRMEDVDPEVKRICEELTGVQYEICFGHNIIGYHTPEELKRIKAELPERRKMNFGVKPTQVDEG